MDLGFGISQSAIRHPKSSPHNLKSIIFNQKSKTKPTACRVGTRRGRNPQRSKRGRESFLKACAVESGYGHVNRLPTPFLNSTSFSTQRFTKRSEFTVQLILFNFVIERTASDTQFLGRGRSVAGVAMDRLKNHLHFHYSQRSD